MKNTTTKAEEAFTIWQELAFRSVRTDAEVNDLLQEIAGEKYNDYDELDDPIWEIINRLTEEELDEFIRRSDLI